MCLVVLPSLSDRLFRNVGTVSVSTVDGRAGSIRDPEQTALAQFRLGCWYSEPPADANRTPDQRRAFKWLYRAAEAGNAPAQFCTQQICHMAPCRFRQESARCCCRYRKQLHVRQGWHSDEKSAGGGSLVCKGRFPIGWNETSQQRSAHGGALLRRWSMHWTCRLAEGCAVVFSCGPEPEHRRSVCDWHMPSEWGRHIAGCQRGTILAAHSSAGGPCESYGRTWEVPFQKRGRT